MGIKLQFVALAAAVLLASAAAPASSAAAEGELAVRAGVVTAMQPVAAAADAVSASTKRQLGSMLGRALGQAVGGSSGQSYELTRVAGSLGADLAAGDGGARASSSYLLVVSFDDASETAFTRSGDQLARLRVGSRVKVIGSGDSATLLPE